MSCIKTLPRIEVTLSAKDFYLTGPDVWMFEPITGWDNAFGFEKFNAVVLSQLNKYQTSWEYKLAYQTAATRTDAPDAPTVIGSSATGANSLCTGALSPAVTGKAWLRLAYAYRNQANPGKGQALLRTSIAYKACGEVIYADSVKLRTISSTATFPGVAVMAVTEWIAAPFAELVQYALIPTGVSGNVTVKPVYQTATTSIESADGWAFLPQATASASERNTNDMQPALTGKMWVRFALGYYLTSGSSLGQADVSVAIAAMPNPLRAMLGAPTNWGVSDAPTFPVTRTTPDNRVQLTTSTSPLGDYYDAPSNSGSWTLSALGEVSGSPSGPGAWSTDPYWIGYDNANREWAVYRRQSGSVVKISGTELSGSPCAIAKVSISSTTATFSVSFDGTTYSTLGTASGTWTYRVYVLQNAATYIIRRETITG